MQTQPKAQQAPSPESAEPTGVTIAERVSRLLRSGGQRSSRPSPEVDWQHRIETLEARVAHLEATLEGLQDAVHRRAVLEDESIGDLRKRTEPDEMARELSRDARERGL